MRTRSGNGSHASHTTTTRPLPTWCRMSLTGRLITEPYHWTPPTWCCSGIPGTCHKWNTWPDRCFPRHPNGSWLPTRTPLCQQPTRTWSWTLTRTRQMTSDSGTRYFRSEIFRVPSRMCENNAYGGSWAHFVSGLRREREMAKGTNRGKKRSNSKKRTKKGRGKRRIGVVAITRGRRTKSKTGLTPAVRKHADLLCLLARSRPGQVRRILASGLADPGLVRAVAECSHNVLTGTVPLTTAQHRRLRRHKTALRRLTADHKGRKRRSSKKVLPRHRALLMRGGFLGSLLGVVAPLIAGALGKVIGGGTRRR